MKIGLLTSSRADYGIYYSLLLRLKKDPTISLTILAFGSHLKPGPKKSIDEIYKDNFGKIETFITHNNGDSPSEINSEIIQTQKIFNKYWKKNSSNFDFIICLGDRFEMFAAVYSTIQYNLRIVHIHGGEKSLGSLDNIYRHSISLASTIHFTSIQEHRDRVIKLLDDEVKKSVYSVGALSLEKLETLKIPSIEEFRNQWGIDLNKPTILITYHPENINSNQILDNINSLIKVVLGNKDLQFIFNYPNLDAKNSLIRSELDKTLGSQSNCMLVENLGYKYYFCALKHCLTLIGNSSSGIIEAASFEKYAINIGLRQLGRVRNSNVIDLKYFNENTIQKSLDLIIQNPKWNGKNIYYQPQTSSKMVKILKKYLDEQAYHSI